MITSSTILSNIYSIPMPIRPQRLLLKMRQQRKQQVSPVAEKKTGGHRSVLTRVFLSGCVVLAAGSYYIRVMLVDTVSQQDIARQKAQYDRLAREEGRVIKAYRDEQ